MYIDKNYNYCSVDSTLFHNIVYDLTVLQVIDLECKMLNCRVKSSEF